jgi:Tol biopolymer transport system component
MSIASTHGKSDQSPSCSPDSGFFVYASLVNGKLLLMRMSLEGGEPKRLSDDVVEFGAVSPDAQQVAMLAVEGDSVHIKVLIKVIPANGGAPVKSVDAHPLISGAMQYSGDGKSIVYPVTEKGVSNLVRESFDGAPPAPVTKFSDLVMYGYAYDWPNKKLAVTRGKSNSDIVLITQQQAAK